MTSEDWERTLDAFWDEKADYKPKERLEAIAVTRLVYADWLEEHNQMSKSRWQRWLARENKCPSREMVGKHVFWEWMFFYAQERTLYDVCYNRLESQCYYMMPSFGRKLVPGRYRSREHAELAAKVGMIRAACLPNVFSSLGLTLDTDLSKVYPAYGLAGTDGPQEEVHWDKILRMLLTSDAVTPCKVSAVRELYANWLEDSEQREDASFQRWLAKRGYSPAASPPREFGEQFGIYYWEWNYLFNGMNSLPIGLFEALPEDQPRKGRARKRIKGRYHTRHEAEQALKVAAKQRKVFNGS